ncbi:MAG: ABC transporter permease [Gemmatimonadaceae bacterium]|jgi:ABC-2 type transport system permease protein|nr:ABC transporter permease [Gemmatimonadaceae bacterium]
MSPRFEAWSTLLAFMRKELRHLVRDRQTFVILLCLPLAQLLLFGYAVRTDVNEIRIAIAASAADPAATSLRAQFANSDRFILLPSIPNAAAAERLFRSQQTDVVVVLGPRTDSRTVGVTPPSLLIITDASDPNTSTTMANYAQAVVRDWQALRSDVSGRVAIDVRARMRYNPTLRSVNLFVPGLIALILTLVTSLMTALSLSREKERGTMELLLVSPLRPWQIIVGKVIPYLGLALVNVVSVLLAARFVFLVPFAGSYWLLMGASVLFALVSLALGVLIAALTSSQLAATLAALGGTLLPSTMLSGLIFPIASMPEPLQWVTTIVPARWFVEIIRGVMLQGTGVDVVWRDLLILSVMLVVLLVAAIRRTSVRLA